MDEQLRLEILALIPARGGSKQIHRKNLRLLGGKPLIAHTIEQACQAKSVTRIVVSTDDVEIAARSQQYGSQVIWRPAEISGDDAASESALLHVLDYLQRSERYEPDLVVFLQATSPIRRPRDIDQAVQALIDRKADSLLSVVRFDRFLWRQENGRVESFNYDYRRRPRRQDRNSDYMENGSLYIFKPWVLRKHNNRLGGKIALYEMDVRCGIEIDDLRDWQLCEWALQREEEEQQQRDLPEDVRLLVLDFDGVLTDNRVWVDGEGKELVAANRGDGFGLARLRQAGVDIVVLSTETNAVVAARCEKLKIPFWQGLDDKGSRLRELMTERLLAAEQVVYVGNDVNDLECFAVAGYRVAVADAHPEVVAKSDLVLTKPGGQGAVRELCDLLLDHLKGRERHNATRS